MEGILLKVSFGDVRKKKILTSNHFVSHMIEHIAWRMGLSIELTYKGQDWKALGFRLGEEIKKFPSSSNSGTALGMIDDGSAQVSVTLGKSGLEFSSVGGVELNWFLNSRCEQISSGAPLVELATGLSQGLQALITAEIWTVEDPHHTWEGIYRGIGIALGKIFMPVKEREERTTALLNDLRIEKLDGSSEIVVSERGVQSSTVRRGTAETGITVRLDFENPLTRNFEIEVDQSIFEAVRNAEKLLSAFADSLGVGLEVNFKAIELSSSHVVMEDIGLVVGRALLEILKQRMVDYGVNVAGSSLATVEDALNKNVRVGISVEGRKFWRLIPKDGNFQKLKGEFVIGQNVLGGLRSEDLYDFLDGLSGGMSASLMIHITDYSDPEAGWIEIFTGIGGALKEAFLVNPYRRGVPPGVKATLA